MLGALLGLAMIITYRLVMGIDPAVAYLALISSADLKIIDDLGGAQEVSRYGKFSS